MLFEKVESRGLAQYSYIIGQGYEAVVIDPRRDCQIYIDLALKESLQITHILETHRHEDFAVGSTALAELTGATIWHADAQLPYEYGIPVELDQVWQLGSLTLKALHTPGHTEGSRSYVLYADGSVPWCVFTGDVLFPDEVGRVDFLGMDRASEMAGHLYNSIFELLLPLGDGVILCPGHGYGSACGSSIADRPLSTLGIERKLNPRLQFENPDAFIADVARKLPKPGYFTKMEAWNLIGAAPVKHLSGVQAFSPQRFSELLQEAELVDLRSINAFAGGHIPGALSISVENMPSYLGWFVDTEAPVLLIGESDEVNTAVTYMNRQGYDNVIGYLSGGMDEWAVSDMPIETTKLLTPSELYAMLDQSADGKKVLIDVRSPEEFEEGAIRNAQNIPIKGFTEHIPEIPLNKTVVMYCAVGARSAVTVSALQRAGYPDVAMLRGGLIACGQSMLSIEKV